MPSNRFVKQVPIHGRRAYLTRADKLVARSAFATGGEAAPNSNKGGTVVIPGAADTVALWEDFLANDTGQLNGWTRVNADVDTGASNSVSRQSFVGGVMRLSFQGTPLNAPNGAIGLVQSHGGIKNWKPNAGNLRFAARVKLPSLASVNAYIGFSDSGGSEMPAYDTGTNAAAGFLSNMTDGIGFMYSNLGGSTVWRGVAVAGDVDQSIAGSSSQGPTANVYDVLEIELSEDSGQRAYFFVNGSPLGSTAKIDNPVDATKGLVPGIWVFGSDTGTIQVDVDWVACSQNRDTGT